MNKKERESKKIICYHCGDICKDTSIAIGDKYFCCNGCKTVYEMLNENEMCDYYSYTENPGLTPVKPVSKNKYEFLNDPDLVSNIAEFQDDKITTVNLLLPQIHCSSCVWLLENLFKFDEGILNSKSDFLKKTVRISYNNSKTTLKKIAELLDTIGYEPEFSLDNEDDEVAKDGFDKKILYKIGVAGFCFGNIMLLSFPEYLSIEGEIVESYRFYFTMINFILSLPVMIYSGSEYYISAFKSLKNKFVNIDVPITIGVIVIFLRSTFEIFTNTGAGYFDSLAGLIFLLLIGKLFQSKTYGRLNFERNYKSYFPISVTLKKENEETTIPVSKLEVGHRILVRNNELIPADSILMSREASVDYSFVTGESNLVKKVNGSIIYAGGRHFGSMIELEVVKEISQSYLTQLWNDSAFSQPQESFVTGITNICSKYFTYLVILIALLSAIYWFDKDTATAWNALTAVLIIACPCALALSAPFSFGSTMRIFGRNEFYLKSTSVVETLSKITDIVFDKTGTLTETNMSEIVFEGAPLTEDEKQLVASVTRNSSHPISSKIYSKMKSSGLTEPDSFDEVVGQGIVAEVNENIIKIGSKKLVGANGQFKHIEDKFKTRAYISINNKVRGVFLFSNYYRKDFDSVIEKLKDNYTLSLLSGDNESEKKQLEKFFPKESKLLFNQTPQNKLDYIKNIQTKNKKVLMIGDGLNDAGALKQSEIGIAISENVNNFSPACDAILSADSFGKLENFIKFSRTTIKVIIASFVISFFYNVIGLSYAVRGELSPLIAAILMPLSSITIVFFTTSVTNILARKKGLL